MSVYVTNYGLHGPRLNADIVRDQMRAAHNYQNTLIEIERAFRAHQREFVERDPAVAVALSAARETDTVCAEAAAAVKQARAASRQRAVDPALTEALRAARAVHYPRMDALYAARKAVMESQAWNEMMDEAKKRKGDLLRSARHESSVFWGTYLKIEDAVGKAAKMPLWDGLDATDPHFHPWTGEGSVTVQIQSTKPATTNDIIAGTDTRVRITAPDPEHDTRRIKTDSKRAARHRTLWLRVGSTGPGNRMPIWATWPMILDRPLPDGANVTWVTVLVRRLAHRWEWKCTFTIDDVRPERSAPEEAVAVNVGWRLIDRSVRVDDSGPVPVMDSSVTYRCAVAVGTDGQRYECRMPPKLVGAFQKVTDLQSIRSDKLDLLWPEITRKLNGIEIPEWFSKRTETADKWRSQARFASLVYAWEKQRFPGDEAAFEYADAWRRNDRHLWIWERDAAANALRWRDTVYGTFASMLAKRYRLVIVNGSKETKSKAMDLRKFARSPDVADEEGESQQTKRQRVIVAPHKMRNALKRSFRGDVAHDPTSYTTKTCHSCGALCDFDAAANLMWRCEACGEPWDQDENNSRNMLKHWREQSGGTGNTSITRAAKEKKKPGGRWAKVKALAAEKRAARRAAGTSAATLGDSGAE